MRGPRPITAQRLVKLSSAEIDAIVVEMKLRYELARVRLAPLERLDTAEDAAVGICDPATEAGAHALRSAARVKALELVNTSCLMPRASIDVEAASRQARKRFVNVLPVGDKLLLRIFRCGAIRTPTRRHRAAGL